MDAASQIIRNYKDQNSPVSRVVSECYAKYLLNLHQI